MNKTLAIRGTKENAHKVIELLVLLGGYNKNDYTSDNDRCFFYINRNGVIDYIFEENIIITQWKCYTVESFIKEYPYTINDFVKIDMTTYLRITNMYTENGIVYYEGHTDEGVVFVRLTPLNILEKINEKAQLNGYNMITAQEARKLTDDYNINRANILRVLGDINGQIKDACNMGLNYIFVCETQLKKYKELSDEQINSLISEIKHYGYNVTPKYEKHNNIAIECKIGYETQSRLLFA